MSRMSCVTQAAGRNASDPSGTFPAATSRRKNSVSPAEVLIREAVVEPGQILGAHRLEDAGRHRRLRGERVEVLKPPVAGRDQAGVDRQSAIARAPCVVRPTRRTRTAARSTAFHSAPRSYANRYWLSAWSPVTELGRTQARPEMQRRVADDEAGVVLLVAEAGDVDELGVARHEGGSSRPRRSRTAARAARRWSSSCGSRARGGRAARTPAAWRTARRCAPDRRCRSRDRGAADSASRRARTRRPRSTLTSSVPAAICAIQLGRNAVDQLAVQRHHAAVDGAVDRVAVDVRDPPDSHGASCGRRRGGRPRRRTCG